MIVLIFMCNQNSFFIKKTLLETPLLSQVEHKLSQSCLVVVCPIMVKKMDFARWKKNVAFKLRIHKLPLSIFTFKIFSPLIAGFNESLVCEHIHHPLFPNGKVCAIKIANIAFLLIIARSHDQAMRMVRKAQTKMYGKILGIF